MCRKKIENTVFSFTGQSRYSGLQVSRDPGAILIWIASVLFLAGLGAIFYFPRHQIWIAVTRQENQENHDCAAPEFDP